MNYTPSNNGAYLSLVIFILRQLNQCLTKKRGNLPLFFCSIVVFRLDSWLRSSTAGIITIEGTGICITIGTTTIFFLWFKINVDLVDWLTNNLGSINNTRIPKRTRYLICSICRRTTWKKTGAAWCLWEICSIRAYPNFISGVRIIPCCIVTTISIMSKTIDIAVALIKVCAFTEIDALQIMSRTIKLNFFIIIRFQIVL